MFFLPSYSHSHTLSLSFSFQPAIVYVVDTKAAQISGARLWLLLLVIMKSPSIAVCTVMTLKSNNYYVDSYIINSGNNIFSHLRQNRKSKLKQYCTTTSLLEYAAATANVLPSATHNCEWQKTEKLRYPPTYQSESELYTRQEGRRWRKSTSLCFVLKLITLKCKLCYDELVNGMNRTD